MRPSSEYRRVVALALAAALSVLWQAAANAQTAPEADEPALTQQVRVAFATVEEGRRLAQTSDEYSQRTGPLERQLKVRSLRPLSESQYLAELGSDVSPWSAGERDRLSRAIESLREPLSRLPLPLPPRVVLVRMSGRVNGEDVAYTRGSAIYLPAGMVGADSSPQALADLVAHELFHVASRQDRDWRDAMYATIGFKTIPELRLPAALQERRITNPDAPRIDSAIQVSIGNRGSLWVVPLLLATVDRIADVLPHNFMEVMALRWMALEGSPDAAVRETAGDSSRFYDTRELGGFLDQVGRNTTYIIHPEEILASNFSQMVAGETPRSPQVHARMKDVLTSRAAEAR